jgi:hypothetical protein
MSQKEELIDQARLLISRLERISVDSIWARRSSGQRGALLKWIERFDRPGAVEFVTLSDKDLRDLEELIKAGFEFLERAARERFP